MRYDPQHFLEILEENKTAINPITYVKTKAAVQRALERNFKNSKLYYACLFFIEKKVTLHKHSLQKLLYYTNGFSQLLLGYPLFHEACLARQDGPVFDVVDNLFKEQVQALDSYHLRTLSECLPDSYADVFREQEIILLDTISIHFPKLSKTELIELTCAGSPWLEASSTESKLITSQAISDFFVNLQIEHGIFRIADIPNYVEYLVAKFEGKTLPATGLVPTPQPSSLQLSC